MKTRPDCSNRKLFDFTSDPLACTGFEFAGRLPLKSSREIGDSIVGIGLETLDRDTFDPEPVYDYLEAAGFKYARCQTGWLKCEKTPGVYDFEWLDRIADNLLARGIRPWLVFTYGNPLYTPNPRYSEFIAAHPGELPPGDLRGFVGEVPFYCGERAMAAWLAFARAVAEHFKGRISHFEIWNEPDLIGHFWRFQGGVPYPELEEAERMRRCARDFVEFLKQTAGSIKSVSPDAKIVVSTSQQSGEYISTLAKCEINQYIDIFAYHFYETICQSNDRSLIDQIRAKIRPKEIWMGEGGAPSARCSSLPQMLGVTEYTQAKTLLRRVTIDLAAGAALSSIYSASNLKSYWHDGSDSVCGILTRGEVRPKLAYYALQSLCTFFEDMKPDPALVFKIQSRESHASNTQIVFNSIITGAYRKRGIPVYSWFIPEREVISMEAVWFEGIASHRMAEEFRNPVVLDPMRQNIYRVSSFKHVPWTSFQASGSFPAIDYPLFLTDASAIEGFDKMV